MPKEEFIQTFGEQFGDRRFLAAVASSLLVMVVEQPLPERKKGGQAKCFPLPNNEVSALLLNVFVLLGAWSWYVDSPCFSWGCVSWLCSATGICMCRIGRKHCSSRPFHDTLGFRPSSQVASSISLCCRLWVALVLSWCLWCREEQDYHHVCCVCLDQTLE